MKEETTIEPPTITTIHLVNNEKNHNKNDDEEENIMSSQQSLGVGDTMMSVCKEEYSLFKSLTLDSRQIRLVFQVVVVSVHC